MGGGCARAGVRTSGQAGGRAGARALGASGARALGQAGGRASGRAGGQAGGPAREGMWAGRVAGLAAPLRHSPRAARERRRCGQLLYIPAGVLGKKKKKKIPGIIRMFAGAFGPGASTRKSLQGNFPGDIRRGGATSWLLTQAAPQFPPWCRPRARAR